MYRFYNLQSGSDHNISLSTIFVDDERFLKNYNLKIYFGQGWPGPRINRYNSGFVYHIESGYYSETRCLFGLGWLSLLHFCTVTYIYSFKCFAQSLFMRSGCNCFTKHLLHFFPPNPAVHKLKEVCNNLLIYALSIFEY